ncbi:MAG: hypothetical protein WDO14_01065 [Bacteroidota bacterium]
MRIKGLLLFSFLLTIAVAPTFGQYLGGDNDGSSVAASCITTLDGVGQFSFGSLTGSPTFCDFSQESYTVSTNNAPQDIQYYWVVPSDATILAGQNTPSISVQFGDTPGTVSVTVVTFCDSQTFNMGVTNGVCTMYQGDIDDGSSVTASCISTLDGVGQFSFGTLTGASTFCANSNEGYTINLNNPPADVQFYWSVPSDATIATNPNSASINVLFGTTAGTISVTVVTPCTSQTFNMGVSPGTCSMYQGDIDDGFSVGPSCTTTLDGGNLINVNNMVGSANFCQNATETYSILVDNAPQNTYYNWTVPADAVVSQGQGTNTIIVTFGVTDGTVSVDVITDCSVTTMSMPVTIQNCVFYAGGNNDGFSVTPSCATDLNGGAVYSVTGITGTTQFCFNGNDSYTAVTVNPPANTYYNWTIPSDATILSGQGTATILVQFGVASGNVSVDIITDCSTITPTAIAVTGSSCSFYAGGNNDGFSMAQACATTLDGVGALDPGVIIGSTDFCNFATESYSLNVQGGNVETTYVWSVPPGATIVSGQGTTSILVSFANTSGNVSVVVSNPCQTINVSLPVTANNCIFYSGGNNDGFSVTPLCASNLNGAPVFTTGPVVGTNASCNFSTETYSISVSGASASTTYLWSVPAGSTILSGQGTTSIFVSFGNTSGNVAITITNECGPTVISLPVTIANCVFYAGGDNDGFSTASLTCVSNLNGTVFVPGAIVGSSTYCQFSTEAYSILAPGAVSLTWSVPAGASIISGQGTNQVLVSFGNTDGDVSVQVVDPCNTTTVNKSVTNANCVFYAGGSNDGFSVTTVTNIPLPIALVSFDASVRNGIVYLNWETSSEHDNDFFLVERSHDGKTFESLLKVDGAGTSNAALKYQARDTNPYHGTSYYRLSQTDYDGSTAYYRVIAVKIENFAEVTKLYPNPVSRDEEIHIDYFAEEDGQIKISVVDPAGVGSGSDMIEVKAGVNLFTFTPHFKSAGVYVIIIRSKDKAQALRLVVL